MVQIVNNTSRYSEEALFIQFKMTILGLSHKQMDEEKRKKEVDRLIQILSKPKHTRTPTECSILFDFLRFLYLFLSFLRYSFFFILFSPYTPTSLPRQTSPVSNLKDDV